MKKDIYVGIGGAAGSILRYFIHQLTLPFQPDYFRPLLTMFINISGSFILGFLMILFAKRFPVREEIRLGITTGVLGGYTTFSTLCKESVLMSLSGNIVYSMLYVILSLLLGALAAWLGIKLAEKIDWRKAS